MCLSAAAAAAADSWAMWAAGLEAVKLLDAPELYIAAILGDSGALQAWLRRDASSLKQKMVRAAPRGGGGGGGRGGRRVCS